MEDGAGLAADVLECIRRDAAERAGEIERLVTRARRRRRMGELPLTPRAERALDLRLTKRGW